MKNLRLKFSGIMITVIMLFALFAQHNSYTLNGNVGQLRSASNVVLRSLFLTLSLRRILNETLFKLFYDPD